MRKLLVFQHVANEILGTLHPLVKDQGFRVRYVNFQRQPDAEPSIEKYNGLIVLGGNMAVYEADLYRHIQVESRLIEKALHKNIPVLGICLGAQLLAHVLGSPVRKSPEREMGWLNVHLTEAGRSDKLFEHFSNTERLFQMHGDSFAVPKTALHLAYSQVCPGQAFRYGEKAYGLQFHLEVDQGMISRWLKSAANRADIEAAGGADFVAQVEADSHAFLQRSLAISRQTFARFLEIFGLPDKRLVLGSEHARPPSRRRS